MVANIKYCTPIAPIPKQLAMKFDFDNMFEKSKHIKGLHDSQLMQSMHKSRADTKLCLSLTNIMHNSNIAAQKKFIEVDMMMKC